MKVLNKEVIIEGGKVIIREEIEKILTKEDLDFELRDIQMQRSRLQDQNSRIISDYNKLVDEEGEIKELISQLTTNEPIEEIRGAD